jgi:hypothetical protein
MREQEPPETKPAESRSETEEKPQAKRDEKRRTHDTLSDENPLIFRGMD